MLGSLGEGPSTYVVSVPFKYLLLASNNESVNTLKVSNSAFMLLFELPQAKINVKNRIDKKVLVFIIDSLYLACNKTNLNYKRKY
jgi:hypothetical protein